MPKHSNKLYCDSHEVLLCETTKTNNSEVLSHMSNMMVQMIKMMQEISEALPSKKEDMSDAHNLDQENPCIIDDHGENYGEIQLVLITEYHGDELNIVETVSNPIDIVVELTVKVE
ncbi:hypothetical protein PVK06_043031 [Gossypium arboreum]|uniref:Uncharacterized protein n=1 Tax=Gossypium arboreum TaxID=29729 RepID=A0ABR0MMT7_GOSAR|nr:hypothetical protein PVK06_043031 [Gossypium arboreum]